jgi:uncharacterized damage-inducible protein DinB
MRSLSRFGYLLALVLAACKAQDASPPPDTITTGGGASTLTTDFGAAIDNVEKKLVELANAIPENKYNWKPEGARTVRQVLLHVASDNYLFPAMLGHTPDPATGITTDYATAQAFEARNIPKDSVVAELTKSFAFIRQSLAATSGARLGEAVTMFGQPFTGQSAWLLAVTHIHEHLGQMIAYARSNGIKPPWS